MTEDIKDRLGRIESLPTSPRVVDEVMAVLGDARSSVSDVARRMDPSMAVHVLKAANVAYGGRGGSPHIGSVEQAISALGYSGFSSIVLHMPLLSTIDETDPLFDLDGFVRHSSFCAVLSRTASFVFGLGDPQRVHVSGMLHGIGTVIIYQLFRDEWRKISLLMEREQWGRPEAERAVIGTDHANIGSMLLELWGLPAAIVESVRLHHLREEIGERREPYAVWLGDKLARESASGAHLTDFGAFFRGQREFLECEMPGTYMTGREIDLFEAAWDELRAIGGIEGTSGRGWG